MIQIIFYPKGLTFFSMHKAKLFRFSFQLEYLHCTTVAAQNLI